MASIDLSMLGIAVQKKNASAWSNSRAHVRFMEVLSCAFLERKLALLILSRSRHCFEADGTHPGKLRSLSLNGIERCLIRLGDIHRD